MKTAIDAVTSGFWQAVGGAILVLAIGALAATVARPRQMQQNSQKAPCPCGCKGG